jgi:hypothetical protein
MTVCVMIGRQDGSAPERWVRRALLAVAHSLLTVVCHLLSDRTWSYRELGEKYFDRPDAEYAKTSLVRRLTRLGYDVTVKPKAA